MDFNLLKEISTFGSGAVLAVIVLYWKKHDDVMYQNALKLYLEESQKRETQLMELVRVQIETLNTLKNAITETKNAITQLDIFIKMQKRINDT